MNDVKIFNSPMFGELRVTRNEKGELLFCLGDVCNSLGLHTGMTKKRLDEKGVSLIYTPTNGGEQALVYINEPNFYRCVFQSRKKAAAAFQDWVFNEVLPSLRKTGGYIVTTTTDTPEMIMARALKVADETIKRNEQRMRELEAQSEQQAATIDLQKKGADCCRSKGGLLRQHPCIRKLYHSHTGSRRPWCFCTCLKQEALRDRSYILSIRAVACKGHL